MDGQQGRLLFATAQYKCFDDQQTAFWNFQSVQHLMFNYLKAVGSHCCSMLWTPSRPHASSHPGASSQQPFAGQVWGEHPDKSMFVPDRSEQRICLFSSDQNLIMLVRSTDVYWLFTLSSQDSTLHLFYVASFFFFLLLFCKFPSIWTNNGVIYRVPASGLHSSLFPTGATVSRGHWPSLRTDSKPKQGHQIHTSASTNQKQLHAAVHLPRISCCRLDHTSREFEFRSKLERAGAVVLVPYLYLRPRSWPSVAGFMGRWVHVHLYELTKDDTMFSFSWCP